MLVIYVLWKQIIFSIRHVPKEYCKKASKFKNFAFILGVGHAIWRISFVPWHPVFQLFRKHAIWRSEDEFASFNVNSPTWYDAVYLYSFGLMIFRDSIWYRYYSWSCSRLKSADIKVPFSENEAEKLQI